MRIAAALASLIIVFALFAADQQAVTVGWISRKTIGTWVDLRDPKVPRPLKTGMPIYADSRITRIAVKNRGDTLWVSLQDGSYKEFSCAIPFVCAPVIDLSSLIRAAAPTLPVYNRVINLMSGQRSGGKVLQDAVASRAKGLSLVDLIVKTDKAGEYFLAWCPKTECAKVPEPISVKWSPDEADSRLPLDILGAGLHRVVLARKVGDEWFWTEQSAFVLVLDGPSAERTEEKRTEVARLLGTVREETAGTDERTAGIRSLMVLEINR